MRRTKYKVQPDFNYQVLEKLGYTFNITEGAWFSPDRFVVVYETRSPYQGQVCYSGKPDSENRFECEISDLMTNVILTKY